MTVRTRRWPPIPLSQEERVALLTLRLLLMSGYFEPEGREIAARILARVHPTAAA
jgi:hypothetical protein